MEVTRTQRRSDGTVSLDGQRFEIPARYRQMKQLHLRYARWDLSAIDLIDARRGSVLCPVYPKWLCGSFSPGIRVFPFKSSTIVFGPISSLMAASGPTAAILSPSTATASACGCESARVITWPCK